MFSNKYRKNKLFSETGFRYRGVESSRIEHLTDAVFAFAITLLVIASEVPKSYLELQASMYNFVGFIACSLLLLGIWANHSTFYLKYGMKDSKTRFLNFLFLFVLLFYIYPLKYLFSHVSNLVWVKVIGRGSLNNEAFTIAYNKAIEAQLTVNQWQDLMLRFGLGLFLIYVILGLMHINAIIKKKALELNEQEVFETKFHILNYGYLCLVCVSSMLYVFITGGTGSGQSGLIYLAIPIGLAVLGKVRKVLLKRKFPNYSEFSHVEEKQPAWSEKKAEELVNKVLSRIEKNEKSIIEQSKAELLERDKEINKLKLEIQKQQIQNDAINEEESNH